MDKMALLADSSFIRVIFHRCERTGIPCLTA